MSNLKYLSGHIVFGYPLRTKGCVFEKALEIETEFISQLEDSSDEGVIWASGSDMDSMAAFGVKLHEFEACLDFNIFQSEQFQPTPIQLSKLAQLVSSLPEEMRERFINKDFGESQVFVIWSYEA